MASPLIDEISVALSRRIGDAVAASTDDGQTLTANERMSYVNKAMFKLFDEIVQMSQGNGDVMVAMYPELLSTPVALSLSGGNYTVSSGAANIKDIWKPYQCYISATNIYIKVLEPKYYTVLIAGIPNDLDVSSTNPVVIFVNGALRFFPLSSTFTPYVIYIRKPLNPATGGLLVQNGTYDHSFGYQAQERLIEYTEAIYKAEAQSNS